MKIPYGIPSFGEVRRGGYFYVDKTPFLPVLESAESGYRYLIFLRPRRMGKSLLLSMMEHYYDVARADEFDQLFGGLWIHEHPTPERNRYMVLTLDFSTVDPGGGPEALRQSFFLSVKTCVKELLSRYHQKSPLLAELHAKLDTFQSAEGLIGELSAIVSSMEHRLYVLIDEYDNFANKLLSADAQDLYESVVQRTGFVRTFYSTLKAWTRTGAIARMFITGVSPIVLDDLSSGFNIVSHVSQDVALSTLVGFTRAETERAVDDFLAARPELAGVPELGDRAALLGLLEAYYNGYRFSRQAAERVFNSDMILYFLGQIERRRGYPTQMLDLNVRTDYRRLVRLAMLAGTSGAERLQALEAVLTKGYVYSALVEQFGSLSLSSREQFLSLLYYVGMLTIVPGPMMIEGDRLEIPNHVIRDLQWENLGALLKKEQGIDVRADDLKAALGRMAVDGEIQPFLDLFHSHVLQALGVKDMRRLDEKAIKLMLLTYISVSGAFYVLSEKEMAQGYCDLFLGASRIVPSARFAWLLEIKYVPAAAKPAQIEAAFAQAQAQVERYASDAALVPLLTHGKELKCGSLVFVGAKRVLFRPWPPAERAEVKPAKRRAVEARPTKPAKSRPAKSRPATSRPAKSRPAKSRPAKKAPARRATAVQAARRKAAPVRGAGSRPRTKRG